MYKTMHMFNGLVGSIPNMLEYLTTNLDYNNLDKEFIFNIHNNLVSFKNRLVPLINIIHNLDGSGVNDTLNLMIEYCKRLQGVIDEQSFNEIIENIRGATDLLRETLEPLIIPDVDNIDVEQNGYRITLTAYRE